MISSFVEWICIYLFCIQSVLMILTKFAHALGFAWCSCRALVSFRLHIGALSRFSWVPEFKNMFWMLTMQATESILLYFF